MFSTCQLRKKDLIYVKVCISEIIGWTIVALYKHMQYPTFMLLQWRIIWKIQHLKIWIMIYLITYDKIKHEL